jgi:hypothetical protein
MPRRRYPIRFDPVKLIAAFGGISEVHQALSEVGCDVSERAVRKWIERGVVPGDAVVALHLHSVATDGPDVMVLAEFINGETK